MVTLAAACNCHNGEHHHIHDRHDATELSGACSAGARLQPAGDGSLFVLPANDRILVRDLVLRRVLFLWRPSPRGTGERTVSLEPPMHHGLGDGGAAVCEAGRQRRKSTLRPQRRRQIPPSLRLDVERGGIFVKRRRGADQDKFIRGLTNLAETNTPTWLILFPEGTRFNPANQAVIDRSQEYARSLGIPELRHVLTPKTTGFELSLEHIRNHFAAVYDVTIYYEGYRHGGDPGRAPSPDMFGFFSGQCRKVHVHIGRTPISELPHDTEEVKQWLYDAFCEKDRLLDEVITTGSYTSAMPRPLSLPLQSTLFPTLAFSGVLIGALSHRYGRWWWVGSFVGFSLIGLVKMSLTS